MEFRFQTHIEKKIECKMHATPSDGDVELQNVHIELATINSRDDAYRKSFKT